MKLNLSDSAKRFIGDLHLLTQCFLNNQNTFPFPIKIENTESGRRKRFNPFKYNGTYWIEIGEGKGTIKLIYRQKGLFTFGSYTSAIKGIYLSKPELHYVTKELDALFQAIQKNMVYSLKENIHVSQTDRVQK
nr:MAG TPA: hypothetical protein [Bacteriophage sp.]